MKKASPPPSTAADAASAAAAVIAAASGSSASPAAAGELAKIDPSRERYPLCVVWTPIPILSWLVPIVGHMGICDSQGLIHDFAGPYFIGVDHMLFGDPVKYWDLSEEVMNVGARARGDFSALYGGAHGAAAVAQFDRALRETTEFFRATQNYNFFTNNCHSFVACVLENFGFRRQTWNMVKLTFLVAIHGRYVSKARFFAAHLPFIIICVIILVWVLAVKV